MMAIKLDSLIDDFDHKGWRSAVNATLRCVLFMQSDNENFSCRATTRTEQKRKKQTNI